MRTLNDIASFLIIIFFCMFLLGMVRCSAERSRDGTTLSIRILGHELPH